MISVGLDGGRWSVGEVAVDNAIAVIHRTDEAAWTAVAPLLAASAPAPARFARLPALYTIAELMRVLRAGAAATIPVGADGTIVAAGHWLVAGVIFPARAVAIAELLFPALGATGSIALMLPALIGGLPRVLGVCIGLWWRSGGLHRRY